MFQVPFKCQYFSSNYNFQLSILSQCRYFSNFNSFPISVLSMHQYFSRIIFQLLIIQILEKCRFLKSMHTFVTSNVLTLFIIIEKYWYLKNIDTFSSIYTFHVSILFRYQKYQYFSNTNSFQVSKVSAFFRYIFFSNISTLHISILLKYQHFQVLEHEM